LTDPKDNTVVTLEMVAELSEYLEKQLYLEVKKKADEYYDSDEFVSDFINGTNA
jgi:hypothetical protein